MRTLDWVITIIGLVIIAFVAYTLYKKECARIHQYEMWKHQRSLVKKIEPLEAEFNSAKKLFDEKNYPAAKKALEETKRHARSLAEALDAALAECLNELERGLFQPLKSQVEGIEKAIEDLLVTEEIRYGAEGLVLFEGKWLSPARVKEIEEKRFADAQRAKGLVFFENQWMTPEERARLKEKRFAEEQKAKGLVLFRGEWVTPEKREELLAAERKAAASASTPKPPVTVSAAAPSATSGFAFESKVWVIDDFESGTITWQPEHWSDPAQLELSTLEGSKAMKVIYTGGQQQKTALAHPFRPLDITSRAKLLLDVLNEGKKSVKLSIMFNADQAYETRERMIGPGLHRDVAFDIRGPIFKCATDGWQQYRFAVGRPDAVTRITLMVNTPAQMLIDNIRLCAP